MHTSDLRAAELQHPTYPFFLGPEKIPLDAGGFDRFRGVDCTCLEWTRSAHREREIGMESAVLELLAFYQREARETTEGQEALAALGITSVHVVAARLSP